MPPPALSIVFRALVGASAARVLTVVLPDVLDFFRPEFLSLTGLCLLLALALLILAIRWEPRTLLRTSGMLAGASVTGFAG
jgi:hypothetical protein